ncbi:protein of unknown function [Bartonella clarridgeiae 73]|uniref:Uncharacterized protein n=1 Tax=Bartonella clarridgeiae (strain CCUG 45776 / CIP 104772 / 73) TaxID=696125 RepID=E6YHZ5_BARC7|nr:protein of unknown function [Bartonella clarridgeiae 73]
MLISSLGVYSFRIFVLYNLMAFQSLLLHLFNQSKIKNYIFYIIIIFYRIITLLDVFTYKYFSKS